MGLMYYRIFLELNIFGAEFALIFIVEYGIIIFLISFY